MIENVGIELHVYEEEANSANQQRAIGKLYSKDHAGKHLGIFL
jgi:hypothetical protein